MRPAFQSDSRPRSATSASQAFVSGLTAQPQQIETPEKRTREVLWLWIGLVFGVLTFSAHLTLLAKAGRDGALAGGGGSGYFASLLPKHPETAEVRQQ